jgi:hypothetical protein
VLTGNEPLAKTTTDFDLRLLALFFGGADFQFRL